VKPKACENNRLGPSASARTRQAFGRASAISIHQEKEAEKTMPLILFVHLFDLSAQDRQSNGGACNRHS
jgi:hypothetical protein